MEIDYLSIGLRIRQIRSERKLTQEELAEKADTDHTVISRIEGGRNLTVETLIKIANALDISTDYLLEESLNISAKKQSIGYLLIDCTPVESEFLIKSAGALKSILINYNLKSK